VTEFIHQRHQTPTQLSSPREFILAVPEMRSGVNLSRIMRAAGCLGITQLIVEGNRKADPKISRGAEEHLSVRRCRTLEPVIKKLADDNYPVIGLEQTTGSHNLFTFDFPKKCILLIGHERTGIPELQLTLCDAMVEIPVFGFPDSYNASTAAIMAMYEYCKQHS
tara:strand:- start:165 stop:659 length:495 start_codon:yes stop_codon:yes gene_type:complete